MGKARFRTLALLAMSFAAGRAAAQPAPASRASADPSAAGPISAHAVAGWDEMIDNLRGLPQRLLAKLPASMQADPQVQQEVGRLALEAFTSSALDTLASDGDHPAFVPQINQVLNIGQPNADTNYRVARITPGGSYRIRGTRGSLRLVKISQAGPSPGEPGFTPQRAPRVDNDFNALPVDKHGRFDVLLSPTRPAGYTGEWWELQPTTSKLLLRMVNADWGKAVDSTFSIERTDIPVTRPRPSAAELERRLRALPLLANFVGGLFVDHIEKLRQEGYVNKLKVLDIALAGGLGGQFYYEGPYDLKDDEALIIEAKVPAKCGYSSMILTNEIYETTDWYNNQSSLNDGQYHVDPDGILRVVVSARDPGVPNWLDTAGYPQGLIQGRWTNCDAHPVPTVHKVAVADIRASLPATTPVVTAEERDRIVRDRRAALQQRPLW